VVVEICDKTDSGISLAESRALENGKARDETPPQLPTASSEPDERCYFCREVLSTIAHDLKTPLAVVNGYVELLLTARVGPLNKAQREILEEMQASGQRLHAFIQDFLAYSTLRAHKLAVNTEVGDLNACLEEVCSFWALRFKKKAIAFYFLAGEKLRPMAFDRLKVQHIVANLLDNALKYTPSGGTAWLHVEPHIWERRVEVTRPTVERRIRKVDAPNSVCISVSDTGCGIEPQYQHEIFQEFVRVATPGRVSEGTGLGLSIARRLVAAHGGKIWVESKPGLGSKFSFLLPTATAAEEQGKIRKKAVGL